MDLSPQVAIVMGSDSDLPTLKGAIAICEDFQIPYHLEIVSAHRTPERMFSFAQQAHAQGLKVIIAGAGGAAHLPGMIAALTPLPVIGVPVPSRYLSGLDSLYSIVQMPAGIPVATVAIGNAINAGLLAVQILASHDPELLKRVQSYRQSLAKSVQAKQERLSQVGCDRYLEEMGQGG
jgi:5-(carboxyamino)imidazole ribonucleotide mutase